MKCPPKRQRKPAQQALIAATTSLKAPAASHDPGTAARASEQVRTLQELRREALADVDKLCRRRRLACATTDSGLQA
jgi:hypothetical protein